MSFAKRSAISVAAALVSGALSGCGSAPTPPTSPPGPSGPALQISCANDINVAIRGSSQAVSFALPTITGGAAPAGTICTPASGSAFPVGATKVSCVVTDAASVTATCSFSVNVTAIQIGIKKFETVGDSLTEGQNGLPIRVSVVDVPNSYPTKLSLLLNAAFPSQGIVVTNQGVGNRTIEGTLADLPAHLAADRPEAVLLLSGYNNLTTPCGFGTTIEAPGCDAAVELVEDKIGECIRLIKRTASVRYVFVSTLTPPGPFGGGVNDRRIDNSAIVDLNNRIRAVALAEGAIIVETYTAFVGHEAEYTSTDGLHLRPAGYQAIADAFFARILATVPQSSLNVRR